ncbi:MAG: hypothetical protein DMF89_25280 [Acidobacteria bacterium]|nr:MAG: hypothetical protein DMF89_25280 [Acidobacteriota bacterium]
MRGTIFRLIGRMQSEYLEEVERNIEVGDPKPALDLREVTLLDLEALRFLVRCEERGVELLNCSPYIRKWMDRERSERK